MDSVSPETRARALRAAVSAQPLWIATSGSSMGTTIQAGEEVCLVAQSRPRRGEVWAYVDDGGQVVVHRFVGHRKQLLVFRGDAEQGTDRLVSTARLAGRVAVVRQGDLERPMSRAAGVLRVGRWKLEGARRRWRRLRDGA